MKRIAFTLLVATLVIGVLSQHASSAFDSGPSANGSFQFVLEDGITRYIEFDARQHGNNARGKMTFSDPSVVPDAEDTPGTNTGVQVTAEFDCLRIEGNRAIMGGAITSSNILSAIGQRVLLVVEDNGEGTVAGAPDRLTWGIYGTTAQNWIPKDSERDDDDGASLTWIATDSERTDDVGIPSNRSTTVGCGTFPLSSYSFVDVGHGNLQVKR